jgi:metallophosphoesterase superfamily enzyme
MSKIICVGDIHIKLDNTHLIDIIEQHIIDYIKEYNVNYVILLGDILHYHEKLHTQSLNRACKFIENISKLTKVICIVGNHDYIQNSEFCSNNHWLNPLKKWNNVFVIDKPMLFEENFKGFICVPYVPPGRFKEALDLYLTQSVWNKVDYIFAHQEFKGCKMGAIVSETGDDWELNYPLVISGHIHDKQKPQENINYIGACLQHSFSETGYPTLLLINPQGSQEFKELSLDLPRKKSIYLNLEDNFSEDDITKTLKIADDNDSIRVVIKGDYDKFKIFQQTEKYNKLHETKNIKIVFKPVREENLENHENHSSAEMTSFEDLLYKNVLREKNEKLYTIYQSVIYNVDIESEDILIL